MTGDHLSNEQLDSLLRNELGGADAAFAQAHLTQCADCAALLDALRDEERLIDEALRVLDHTPPDTDAGVVVARARVGARPARTLLAASVAAVLVASIAVAVPGSPVRQWIAQLGADREGAAGAPVAPAPAGGVRVTPGAAFELAFEAHQEAGTISIALGPSPDLEVRAIGQPVAYDVRPDGIEVANTNATASYEVVIPENARLVRVTVAGEVVLTKEGAVVTTTVARDDSGRYVVPLRGSRPGRSLRSRARRDGRPSTPSSGAAAALPASLRCGQAEALTPSRAPTQRSQVQPVFALTASSLIPASRA